MPVDEFSEQDFAKPTEEFVDSDFGKPPVSTLEPPQPFAGVPRSPEELAARNFAVTRAFEKANPPIRNIMRSMTIGERIRMSPLVESILGPPEAERSQQFAPQPSPAEVVGASAMFLPLPFGPETKLGKAILAAYGADFVRNQPEAVRGIIESVRRGDVPEALRGVAGELMGGTMLAGAGREMLQRRTEAPPISRPEPALAPEPKQPAVPIRPEPPAAPEPQRPVAAPEPSPAAPAAEAPKIQVAAPPPPAEGMTRLYHGEGGTAGAGLGGDFFSKDIQRARGYGPNVSYVDVPTAVFEAGQKAAREAGSGTPGDAVLSPDWVKRAKEHPPVEQKVFEIEEEPAPEITTPKVPTVDELISMDPEKVTDWKKAALYGPGVSKAIAESLTEADIPKLTIERGRLGTESAKFIDQAKDMPSGPERDAVVNKAAPLWNKAQILREVIEDFQAKPKPLPPGQALTPSGKVTPQQVPAPAVEPVQKVKTEVAKVSKSQGEKTAKAVKSGLVQRLQDQMEQAPSAVDVPESELTKVTIDIPGDGVFTVVNTKEALGQVLERAKRINTKSTAPQPTAFTKVKPTGNIPADVWVQSSEPTHMVTVAALEGSKRVEVKRPGKPIEVAAYPGKKFFLTSDGTEFRVTEPRSGLSIGTGKTIKDALADAEGHPERLREGRTGKESNFDDVLQKDINENGERPPPKLIVREGIQPQTPPGPGAKTIGEPGKPELAQLTDALRTLAEGQPRPQTRKAFDLGEKISQAKNAAAKALDGLKAARDYSATVLKGMPTWNGLKEAVGNWKLALFENGQLNREFVDKALRGVPSELDRGAISKWLGAGGDEGRLLEQEVNTKPLFKKFYMRARRLPEELKVLAENTRNYFNSRLQQAIDYGFLEDGIEDYIHRIYEKDSPWKKGAIAEIRSGIFTGKPAFAKRRVLDFDYEAEQAGYPVIHDFAKRVAAYDFSLNKAIADRELVKSFMEWKMPDGRPAIDTAGNGREIQGQGGESEALLIKPKFKRGDTQNPKNNRSDYIPFDHPALRKWKWIDTDPNGKTTLVQGDVLVHPDALAQVKAVFGRSAIRKYSLGRGLLRAGSTVKQTMLDLSGFHPTQITVHGWEHRTFKPVDRINLEDPTQRALITHGLEPGDPRGYELFAEGLSGTSLTRHIPVLGPKLQQYNEWLFQSYIPRLKMAMGLHALERNRARFAEELKSGKMTEDQVLHMTANQANAAFGELNYEMLARNKTLQDALRLGLLAPDFLEARGRFAGQAFTKYGKEQRQALLLGAATLYITARIINKILDDQYHFEPRNAFSVVYGNKAYSLRTVQGDLLHLVTDPAKFTYSRLNPIYGRTVFEAVTRRDPFGRTRTPLQQMEDLAKTAIPITFRGLIDKREQTLLESFLNAMGITERRDTANDDVYRLAQSWKQKHGVGQPGEFIYDPDKDPYRRIKLALVFDSPEAAAQEISLALKHEKVEPQKLYNYFNRYGTTAFTGSKANDKAFYDSLSDDQRRTFQRAVEERSKIRKRLQEAFRIYRENFQQVR